MNFKKICITLMLSLTVWAQSDTPEAGAPKDRDEAAFHYHMGLNYYDGLGEPPDYAKAVDHFKRAATHPESFPSPRNAGPMLPQRSRRP